MLAAETAWRILHAEHARMRGLLTSIDRSLEARGWDAPGPPLEGLRRQIERLREFDDETHRPKGHLLLATLRGRAPEVNQLLDQLEAEQRQCAQLLQRALSLLQAIATGDARASEECATLLRRHHALMLDHLHTEDTVLHSRSATLLTPEEWSSIVSSISAVVHPGVTTRDPGR